MSQKLLREGAHLTTDQILQLAQSLVAEAGDRQEDVAAAIDKNQSQVSRALKGERRYVKTGVDIIEHYTDFQIDYPVGHVTKHPHSKED